MNIELQISNLAAQGYSRQHAMELLGFTRYSFESALELIGPLEWPGNGCSVAARAANTQRRGRFTKGMAKSQAMAAAAKRAKHARTVRGVTGNIEDLIKAFGLSIHATTVRRRIAAGMDVEAALFTPRSTASNLGKHLGARSMCDEEWQRQQKGAEA
ncbi:hypothetical protein [Pseudomonas anguilliseptica]|uniref:hypothetical protein n=1 Tax=Pseudomonas anguilliseptica TaxID=53406 RepID=UPI0022AE8375|nr:hypothetical protein [Pseudomonas anguilliseptica]MCZ4321405.1 hypothetical protein [Pseudomonas anguilliseptica]